MQRFCLISCRHSGHWTLYYLLSVHENKAGGLSGAYSVWWSCEFRFGEIVFLKSATSLFLAQWKPVREVISETGSLHIKGSSEEFWNVFYVVMLLWLELNFSLSSGFLSSGFPSSPPYGLIQFSASADWGQSVILVCVTVFVCLLQSEEEEINCEMEKKTFPCCKIVPGHCNKGSETHHHCIKQFQPCWTVINLGV